MSSDKVNMLQNKLRSGIKHKLNKDKQLRSLRCQVMMQNEELAAIKSEVDIYKEELESQLKQISEAENQLFIVDMYRICEKTKLEAHMKYIETYKKGFKDLLQTEQEINKKQVRELIEKEKAQREHKKHQLLKIIEQNEKHNKEVADIEAECDALKQECSVLKNRNTAIMLKLRHKLIEAEEIRRHLMKKVTTKGAHHMDTTI